MPNINDLKGLSQTKQSYFKLAGRTAMNSTYGGIKHGAIVVKGGTVISVGFNKGCFSSFGKRFRHKNIQKGNATLHAEIAAILGLDKSATDGADVYVVRVGKLNDWKISKPCPMCQEALKFCGISRVFYTTDENWEMMRL